jgi:hypothetical protein
MNESCAGSGGTTRGAGGGVGDGRVGSVGIDAGAGDVVTLVGTGAGSAPGGGADAIAYEAAGEDIAYEFGDGIFDAAGGCGILADIGDDALTTWGAGIGSRFCPLFDSLPLPLPLPLLL